MRIGIFGGSFNPIHYGHIGIAKAAIETDLVDEVWLMVSPHNPLKTSTSLLPDNLRLQVAELALTEVGLPIRACDFEFQLERPSFTWKTLDALQKAYPQHTFFLIIGGDNWEIFHKWAQWETILSQHSIIVYPREGAALTERKGFPPPFVLEAPLFPYSSTEVRQAIANHADDELLSRMLPRAIIGLCRQHYTSVRQ